jgi:hypothetical protein
MEHSINFLDTFILGYSLKDILTITSIVLSLTALFISIFDVKVKINNYFRKNNLDYLSKKLLLKLLCSIYIYQQKIERDIFFSSENNYQMKVVDDNFLVNFKKLLDDYQNIYLYSFYKKSKLEKEQKEFEEIYNICLKYGKEKILDKLLFNEHKETISTTLVNEIERKITTYLKSTTNKKYTSSNILEDV